MIHPNSASQVSSAPFTEAVSCSAAPSFFRSVENQLRTLNQRFDAIHAIYLDASLQADTGDHVEALRRTYAMAESNAIRQMKELVTLAGWLVPSTIEGFALKARLLTQVGDWRRDNEETQALILSLIGQLISHSGIAPIDIPENSTTELHSMAREGRPAVTEDMAQRMLDEDRAAIAGIGVPAGRKDRRS